METEKAEVAKAKEELSRAGSPGKKKLSNKWMEALPKVESGLTNRFLALQKDYFAAQAEIEQLKVNADKVEASAGGAVREAEALKLEAQARVPSEPSRSLPIPSEPSRSLLSPSEPSRALLTPSESFCVLLSPSESF